MKNRELVLCLVACTVIAPSSHADVLAPTSTSTFLLRGGPGAYGSPRAGGKAHNAVDIVANQSSPDRETYKVVAVQAGKIAYARMNGSATSGYGHTIIVDHGDGTYALYAHLAPGASGTRAIGADVIQGDVIGYVADLSAGEKSSGNVASCVVAPYDKLQLHFELFQAPAGRKSTGAIGPIKEGSTPIDPTPRLRALGYKEYPPPTSEEKKKIEHQCSAATPLES